MMYCFQSQNERSVECTAITSMQRVTGLILIQSVGVNTDVNGEEVCASIHCLRCMGLWSGANS